MTRVLAAMGIVLCLAAPGCKRRGSETKTAGPAASASSAPKPLRKKPKTSAELPTTDAEVYLGNLDGQIAELTRLVSARPELTANVERLSAAHHTRGLYRGDLDEIQLAVDTATTCTRLEPENAACFLLRAEAQQSLHRFAAARADVERAKALGADRERVAALEADLDWNDGRYEQAVAAIRKARLDRPSSSAAWMREARLEHDLGHDDLADALFEAAEDRLVDTAPYPVAHLDVQRGIQKTEQGLLEEAVVYFREAVARMPTYVAALEHLAETLHALGRDDEAIALYEKVVGLSNDPEFAHALAELLGPKGREKDARELEARARRGYEALLAKYPEAMYWHASEFYLSAGDPQKALELLTKNVAVRPNSASYVALARAELANGRTAEAKAAIDRALAMPVRSAELFATAAAIHRKTGDLAAANGYRDQARRMNPRVELDDP